MTGQEGRLIGPDDLPQKVRLGNKERSASVVSTCNVTLDELEKEYLIKVLDGVGWRKKKAAAILGINPSTLYRKLQRYGFETSTRETVEVAKTE